MIRDLWQDIKYGARMLRKSPGLTSVAVLSLALGMGAISTIFSFVNGIMLRPLPYPHSERLVILDETAARQGMASMSVSYPNFLDWRERNHSFEDIACYDTGGFAMSGGNTNGSVEPEQIKGAFVNQGMFEILGVAPILGRTFTADEDQPDHDLVVILGYGLWQRRYGGDPNILGQTLTMNNRQRVVIGVMPKGFQFPEVADAWGPLALTPKIYTRTDHGLQALARLRPGVTLEQAQAEMTGIAANIETENPVTNEGLGVNVIDLRANLVGDYKKALLILLGVVAFVLLIACVNVANLLLARATSRQKEIAIRAALGANRRRIFRQLVTESLLLGVISGALGLVLALWGMDLLLAAIPIDIPFWMKFDLDWRVLGFTGACSVLTGFVFGTAPAFQASNPDLNETLKEGGRSGTGAGRGRLRSLLVVAEIALSLVLLVGAGLMMRSFISLQNVNAGINPAGVLTFTIVPAVKYRAPEKRIAFFQQLIERVRLIPGVVSAGSNSGLPLSGSNWGRSLTVEGFPVLSVGQAPMINHCVVSPGYFSTMGIPILKGRDFDERDTKAQSAPQIGVRDGGMPAASTGVTIIDERLAREYWPDEDPIGKRIRFGPPEDNEPWHTIVGVVGEVKHERLDSSTRKSVYLPYAQMPVGGSSIAIRTSGRPENLVSAVRALVKELDPDLPLTRMMPMSQIVARSVWQPRLYTALFGVFAAVALILAAVGIYGVMSYAVTQRTREIGLRMALGAEKKDVMKLVVGQGVVLAALGVGTGLVAAVGLTRLMSSLLFGVTATDLATFAAVSVLLAGVALGACFVPARRAAKVDPMVALRYE
ncbi:MAG TPA: ABC transporter permease [Blastocatellia bacterium]|nr:ABC transporter permease [Blastocatellia bacterium]